MTDIRADQGAERVRPTAGQTVAAMLGVTAILAVLLLLLGRRVARLVRTPAASQVRLRGQRETGSGCSRPSPSGRPRRLLLADRTTGGATRPRVRPSSQWPEAPELATSDDPQRHPGVRRLSGAAFGNAILGHPWTPPAN
jgi:hypothetical protein